MLGKGHLFLCAAILSLVLASVAPPLVGTAAADSVAIMGATLPSVRGGTNAVWDSNNHRAFVIGGTGGLFGPPYIDQIVAFSPTDQTTLMGTFLSNGRLWGSSVWDPSTSICSEGCAYIFGGCASNNCASPLILEYDPAAATLTNKGSLMADGKDTESTSAVWNSNAAEAYIFRDASNGFTDVYRYRPSTNSFDDMLVPLAPARRNTAAAWDPNAELAYVFGGVDVSNGKILNDVLRYDPNANTFLPTGATFPTGGRSWTSAVWDPTITQTCPLGCAYIFGGFTEQSLLTNEIVRYDPSTNKLTNVLLPLPLPLLSTSAAFDPVTGNAYIFGGCTLSNGFCPFPTDMIICFHPATASVEGICPVLPSARHGTSAVWDPLPSLSCPQARCAFVFGGVTDSAYTDEIVQFDPLTGAVTVPSHLPSPVAYTSAVWATPHIPDCPTGCAYIFGGRAPASVDDIRQFDPVIGTAVNLGTPLTTPRGGTSAVWDPTTTLDCPQGCAYIFGGDYSPEIQRFEPTSGGTITSLGNLFPHGVEATSAVWASPHLPDCPLGCAYIFGGHSAAFFAPQHVFRFNALPTPTLTDLGPILPSMMTATSATWVEQPTLSCPTGSCAFVYGGSYFSTYYDNMVMFEGTTNGVTLFSAVLPGAREWTSAIWEGTRAYVFGGFDGVSNTYQILQHTP